MSSIYDALKTLQDDNRAPAAVAMVQRGNRRRTAMLILVAVLVSSVLTAGVLYVFMRPGPDAQESGAVAAGPQVQAVVPALIDPVAGDSVPAAPAADPAAPPVVRQTALPASRPDVQPAALPVAPTADEPDVAALPAQESLEALMERARLASDAGSRDEAVRLYESVLERDVRRREAYVQLGALYYGAGDYERAMGVYARALRYFRGDAGLLNNMGSVLLARDRIDEAIGYFDQAREHDLDSAEPLYNLACAHARKGDRQGAIRWLRKAAARNEAVRRWALHDTDLRILMNEPEFLAILANKGEE